MNALTIDETQHGRSVSVRIAAPDEETLRHAISDYENRFPALGYGTIFGRIVPDGVGVVCHGSRSASCD